MSRSVKAGDVVDRRSEKVGEAISLMSRGGGKVSGGRSEKVGEAIGDVSLMSRG